MLRNTRKGFTLIELLIVVVIIGILAAIAIPKFASTKDKAKLASVKTDVRNAMSAQEAFFSDSNKYTATESQLDTLMKRSKGNAWYTTNIAADSAGYKVALKNASISSGQNTCTVAVGSKADATTYKDGEIVCEKK